MWCLQLCVGRGFIATVKDKCIFHSNEAIKETTDRQSSFKYCIGFVVKIASSSQFNTQMHVHKKPDNHIYIGILRTSSNAAFGFAIIFSLEKNTVF